LFVYRVYSLSELYFWWQLKWHSLYWDYARKSVFFIWVEKTFVWKFECILIWMSVYGGFSVNLWWFEVLCGIFGWKINWKFKYNFYTNGFDLIIWTFILFWKAWVWIPRKLWFSAIFFFFLMLYAKIAPSNLHTTHHKYVFNFRLRNYNQFSQKKKSKKEK
jgi:hypothetical protein